MESTAATATTIPTAKARRMTLSEYAGYSTGILLSMLRWFFPLRIWSVLVASAVLITTIWSSEDAVLIARANGIYLIFIALITVGSLCRKR